MRYQNVNGEVVALTPEEEAELNALEAEWTAGQAARELDALRKMRNEKLANTDWWVMPDRTATQAQLDYRQALRDITDTYTSLDDVVWPEEPA